MTLPINTTTPQYQAMLTGLGTLDNQTVVKILRFRKLSLVKKRQWLQRDPLFKATLQFVLKYDDVVQRIREDLT